MILQGNVGDLQRLRTIVNNNWRTSEGTIFEEYYNMYSQNSLTGENKVYIIQSDFYKYISFNNGGPQSIYYFPYKPGQNSQSGFTFVPKIGNTIVYTGSLSGCSINIYDFNTHWLYVHDEHQPNYVQSNNDTSVHETVQAINNTAVALGLQQRMDENRYRSHFLSIDSQDYAPSKYVSQIVKSVHRMLVHTPIIFQNNQDIYCYMFTAFNKGYLIDEELTRVMDKLIQIPNKKILYRFPYGDVFIKVQYGQNIVSRFEL